ncbi:MAG: FeoB-associated Cys-rich membrane protein [Clostridia bacterium]|nr:FeoB-associated Cys-rich membrane protein [Clostridia bacterium]
MLQFLQANIGSIAALAVVALFVFLAIRRLVLDKKAGIGACGQKCSQCAKMGHCEEAVTPEPVSECSGSCSACKYSAMCHKQ